jgi:arylsulfatase A-like enzyme
LADAGIPTVQYGQAVWLLNEYGMTRGFSEEKFIRPTPGRPSTKGKWSTGDDILDAIDARLRRQGQGPLFLFFHDLDPHSPFDLGRIKKGSGRERYLSEMDLVEERIGQLRRLLEELGLAERTTLIFSSDHGEGFGEHGTSFHGQNLYDEQIHVPLLIHHPYARPHEVEEPVTLIDLGPTILDLMGLSTPSYFMGQSLVPYLAGKTPKLSRPIIAEGRLKQAMVLPNGLKLIRNQREKTFEIYDLSKDPKELDNLYGKMGDQGPLAMQKLVQFFETYQIRKDGYEIPYRR